MKEKLSKMFAIYGVGSIISKGCKYMFDRTLAQIFVHNLKRFTNFLDKEVKQ